MASLILVACHESEGYRVLDLTAKGGTAFESVNLANAEPWGSWSDGSPLALLLNEPLPKRFRLIITVAHVYGDNANKKVEVVVGDSVQSFTAPADKKAVEVTFHDVLPGSRLILFKIPNPQSPRAAGKSTDTRELGIGIEKIEIAPALII